MPGKSIEAQITSVTTGEILDFSERRGTFVYIPHKPKWYGEEFMMVFQEAFIALAKDKDVAGRPRRVLDYMMGKLNFENYVAVTQVEIAHELGLDRQNVNAAIKLLLQKGIIHQGPKLGRSWSYRLNSHYGWRGKLGNIREYRRLHEQGPPPQYPSECKDCGERVTVIRGERGPLPERCDVCREERKREKTRARVQALRDQRRGS